MKRFNKATAAALAGALATLVTALYSFDAETVAAGQTLLTTVLVYLLPNREV